MDILRKTNKRTTVGRPQESRGRPDHQRPESLTKGLRRGVVVGHLRKTKRKEEGPRVKKKKPPPRPKPPEVVEN